jgi:two-component system cell cycle response regulator
MPTRVLLVGDADEARWLRMLLDSQGPSPFRIEQAPDLERAAEYLSKDAADVVLLHIGANKSSPRKVLESAHAAVPRVPLIALSDVEDEAQAIELLQSGAQDFLSKARLTRAGVIRSFRYAIERHRLQKDLQSLSLLDDLTGLHNRRGFQALAEQHLRFIRRKGAALLVYLDLDNLKGVNDTLGHLEGNRALVETAVILRSCFRQADIVARMGGDEFCVLMTDACQDTAQEVRRRLAQRLERSNAISGRRYQLSLSVGIANVPITSQPVLEELLSLADALMYEQKRTKQARASGALSQ